jgi:hypothetical protein
VFNALTFLTVCSAHRRWARAMVEMHHVVLAWSTRFARRIAAVLRLARCSPSLRCATIVAFATFALAHGSVRAEAPPPSSVSASGPPTRMQARSPRLHRYLSRELAGSARFVDHGVVAVSAAGGYPHRYRMGAAIGLLDHLTIGAQVHWLPGQSRPRVAPQLAIAFYRWRAFEMGAVYDRTLYPPPSRDLDPGTLSFQRDAHWALVAFAVSQAWLSGGFEVGTVIARVRDPSREDADDGSNFAAWRVQAGGGVFLRAGTRRWGFTANMRAPWVAAELAFDLRFGAFEQRPRGGWRPRGFAADRDRRPPTR